MLAALKAFFDSISKTMAMYTEKIKNQPTTELVRDRKFLKRASNITEQILEVTNNYTQYFSKKDFKKYEQLRKKFLRYN